jgi:hypothetical protein
LLSATGVIAEADFDPRLRTLLENIIPEHGTMDDYVVEHDFPHVGKRVLLLIQSVLTVEGRKAEKHQAAFDNGLLQIEAPSASIESS